LELRTILESNGLNDTIWAMRAVEGKDKEIRLFAADCAEMVLPIYENRYPDDNRPRLAIQAARDYANGLIPMKELAAARAARAARAAWDARAASAAWDAADAAWDAAWAAARAASDAASDAARDAAWAARDAAWAASAAWDAASAAWDARAARDAAWAEIKQLLLKYI
jgi:hypothetical protein